MNRRRVYFLILLIVPAILITLLIPEQTIELPKRSAASIGNIKCTIAKFLPNPSDSTLQIAPLFENLGNHSFTISTENERVQAFFDQGLRLTYAFNHAEAHRSFMEVTRLEPENPMGYWGQAYTLGPNINDPAPFWDRRARAWSALEMANKFSNRAGAKEKALIRALNSRYSADSTTAIESLNIAYMRAMEKVKEIYSEDSDILTLYAASAMNTMPWNYWDSDGNPSEFTPAARNALESAISINPDNPGAHHYYIHLVELPKPDLGVPSAQHLENLMPAAGHLVHMPSHIYIRVGRYKDAVRVNQKAILADEDYISQCYSQGMYPLAYYPHNIHFLWSASSLIGESQTAISAAVKTAEKVPVGEMDELHFLQDFASTPLLAYVRFGKWNNILTYPIPSAENKHLRLMRHYARGIAFVRKNNPKEAMEELQAIEGLRRDPELSQIVATAQNSSDKIADIAYEIVAGELAMLQGNPDNAAEHLKKAVALESKLTYTEPSAWHIPPRQNLGDVLYRSGKFKAAESVFREDLKVLRNNGWSLMGLYQSLRAQGKDSEAANIKSEFDRVWRYADITIDASVL